MSLPLIIFVTSSHQMFTHSIDNLTHPFTPSSHHTVLAMCGNDWTRVKRTKSISDRCISIKPLRVWPPLSTAAVFIFVSSGRLRTGNWMDWNVLWGRDFASSNFTLPSLWRHKLLGKLDVDWATSQQMMHACMPVYIHGNRALIIHVHTTRDRKSDIFSSQSPTTGIRDIGGWENYFTRLCHWVPRSSRYYLFSLLSNVACILYCHTVFAYFVAFWCIRHPSCIMINE